MEIKEVTQGQIIVESGQKIDALYLVTKGTVSASYKGGKYLLNSGDVIGLCEYRRGEAIMEYKAEEAASIIAYPLDGIKLPESVINNAEALKYFIISHFRQIYEMFRQYKRFWSECNNLFDYLTNSYKEYAGACAKYSLTPGELPGFGELSKISLSEDIPFWMIGYYVTLKKALNVWEFDKDSIDFAHGFLLRASEDMCTVVGLCSQMQAYKKNICSFFVNEKGMDFLELLTVLYGKVAGKDGLEADSTAAVRKKMDDVTKLLENLGFGEISYYKSRRSNLEKKLEAMKQMSAAGEEGGQVQVSDMEDLTGSLHKILAYAKCDGTLESSFIKHVQEYKQMPNKNGTEEDVRTLRHKLTKEFYQVYTAAFKNSLQDQDVPTVVKMLFNFGYVDKELAGEKNAAYLCSIINQLPTAPERGVYSIYEWLMAVYEGKKEPSRNEFDLDYVAYLVEQRKTGAITKEEEKNLLTDNTAKVLYELENVFPMVNKITYGRITTFCPIFSEHNVMKPLDSILVSADNLHTALDGIRTKDFGAYYRETMFSAPEQGVQKEFINVEILPDFILMPNVGIRGVMWQEIEGKRRTTPARMMSSIFQLEDLSLILIRLTGEFRWEMCKRVQGARWNDVSERSLTSEYFDYIQFYKKNQELSTDAKEKIKTDMGRAKNSFKEMFIMDYTTWILFESNGSPRMNKIARNILYSYCTFTAAIREKLKANPMYREISERYEIRMGQKRHRLENLCQKLRSTGKPIPEEIEQERQFLYM